MIFRLTRKLAAKIKAGKLPTLPRDANPFTDWSAPLFVVARTQYILLANTSTLYSTVLYGAGITGDSRFIDGALTGIREFMDRDGLGVLYERFIEPSTGLVHFAKALNRSVTGSMNDLVKFATCELAERDSAPLDVGLMLNKMPMTAIATRGTSHGFPRDAFKALADERDAANE